MLSGRSTVVVALSDTNVEIVLALSRKRLGLADDGTTTALCHGSVRVPADVPVSDWPGVQAQGEISEYQLLVTQ
eukprot:1478252-Amphidinium_carterae.1